MALAVIVSLALLGVACGSLESRIQPDAAGEVVRLELAADYGLAGPGPVLQLERRAGGPWRGSLILRTSQPSAGERGNAAAERRAEARLEDWRRQFGCRHVEVREPWLTCATSFERGAPDWASVGLALERLAAEAQPVHTRVMAARAEAERRFAEGKGGLTVCADGRGIELTVRRGGEPAETLNLTPCGAADEPTLPDLQRRAWQLFDGVVAAARR